MLARSSTANGRGAVRASPSARSTARGNDAAEHEARSTMRAERGAVAQEQNVARRKITLTPLPRCTVARRKCAGGHDLRTADD